MRPQSNNPLDLNNFPEDYSARDNGKQVSEDSSSCGGGGGYSIPSRKKKSSSRGKDESGKVYECRFCSLTFCKSQALGGHMNRHRQERETEQLNRARQIVYNNDTLSSHLGGQPMTHGGFHHQPMTHGGVGNISSIYQHQQPRLFPSQPTASPSSINLQPPQPYLYPSPSSRLAVTYPPSQPYPPPPPPPAHHHHPPVNEYYVGHVINPNYNNVTTTDPNNNNNNNYTCIGAPVGFGSGGVGRGGDTAVISNLEGPQKRMDASSSTMVVNNNRFQDGSFYQN